MFVSSTYTKHWVTLHSRGCHLNCSGYVCQLNVNKTLGYTILMGVPPKLQPIFVCQLNLNKTLGYRTLMGVPPKITAAMFVSST